MKFAWAGVALMALILSACGEKEETAYFQVSGEAKVEKQADLFFVSLEISERGKDKQKSMEAAAIKLDEVRKALSELKGLEQAKIRTSGAKTNTVRPRGCYPDEPRYNDKQDYPENCDPVEFVSTVHMVVEGEPARAAGTVLSLLTELKVEEVNLGTYGMKYPEEAQMEARRLAVENARKAAKAMAEQAGARLGRPIEIRYGEDFDEDAFRLGETPKESDEDAIVVKASRLVVRPFWLPPDTVEFEAEVVVKFALEKPEDGK